MQLGIAVFGTDRCCCWGCVGNTATLQHSKTLEERLNSYLPILVSPQFLDSI